MLLASFNLVMLLPFAIFGAIAAAVWVALEFMATRDTKAEKRLDEFRDPNLRKRKEELASAGAVTRVLEAATPALAKPLQPKTEKEAGQLKQRLSEAGLRHDSAANIFLGLKIVGL